MARARIASRFMGSAYAHLVWFVKGFLMWNAEQMFAKKFAGQDELDEHAARFLEDRRGGLRVQQGKGTVELYVNEGRWVGDCPNCNGGIAGPPAVWREPHGVCLGCGYRYKVRYPKDRVQIEAVLERRPMVHRNANVGESVGQLERENVLMGVN